MALIRKSVAETLSREAIVLDLGDLVRQGEQIKARARAEADRILAEAQAERQRLIADAAEVGRQEGFARGVEEGRKQGEAAGRDAALGEWREKLIALESGWTQALAAFESERERMLLEAKQDIVELAATVARLVTKRAVTLDPGSVADQVAAVLALLTRPTRVVLAVNPADAPIVREALPSLAQRFTAAAHVEIATDEQVSRGGCIARTAGGTIDATIDTQLERIAEALLPGPPQPAEPKS